MRSLVAEMGWLKRLSGRNRSDRIRTGISRNLGTEGTVIDKIRQRRLTWLGPVTRMDDEITSKGLHCHVKETRTRGRQT